MKRSLAVVVVLSLIGLIWAIFLPRSGFADGTTPNWLQNRNIQLEKTADLPNNTEPFTYGVDCTPETFRVGFNNDGQELRGCSVTNVLGTTANGYVIKGSHGTLRLNQLNHVGYVMASPPNSPATIVTATYPGNWLSGALLQVSTYSTGSFSYVSYWGVPMIYGYEYNPTERKPLKDAQGTLMRLLENSMAYSANGQWLVVARTDGGIMRYDTKTWNGKLVAWEKNFTIAETKGVNMAVSNNGKYIAVNTATTLTPLVPTLKVFDAESCVDLSGHSVNEAGINQCEYNDIWNGIFRGKAYGPSLKAQLPTAEYPRHVRFDGDSIITFDAVYDRTSPTEFKVASYKVVNQTFAPDAIELLGMGDSYISGDGAFGYRAETDTSNNGCHNSIFSYPYIIGTKLYASFESVACSGAKMNDITTEVHYQSGSATNEDSYRGQVKDNQTWFDRKPTQQTILNSFLPGYANQWLFSSKYEPRNTLLSIGGNDIHFADILKSCVSPQNTETCYSTYESRVQLMQSIIDRYSDLVKTYQTVAKSSYGKVFVVGYPQVAKPGGDCGANVNLNKDEVQFSADVIGYLNSIIKRAASDAGVIYVDNENALSGYRLCEAPKGKAAVNGFTLGKDSGIGRARFIGKESYHPTAFGHTLLAASILAKTSNLTQSMPSNATNYGPPALDPNVALLKNVPKQPYTTKVLIWKSGINNTQVLIKGAQYARATETILKSGTAFQLFMHSEPILLAEGIAGNNQSVITIPSDIQSGFHTIDLYGVDEDGHDIDVRQVVFVATAQELATGPCLGLPAAGKDTDNDGLDDACDADVDDPAVPAATTTTSASVDTGESTDGLLVLYVTTAQKTQTTSPSAEESGGNSSANALASSTASAQASDTQKRSGEEANPVGAQAAADIAAGNTTVAVLGETNTLKPEPGSGANRNDAVLRAHNIVISTVVFTALFLAIAVWLKRYR